MGWSQVFALYIVSLVPIPSPIVQTAIFSPNCTLPPRSTTFVTSPNTRGTLSILWSCLSIITLCTWNIQHLNIPSNRPYFDDSGRRFGYLKRAWWAIVDLRTTFKWMLLTVLIPEYIMGRALSERLAAASSLGALRSRFGDEMELAHAYIMNMGGYYLDFSQVGFSGVDISSAKCSNSSGMSSTAVDYSGVHFSGNHVDKVSEPSKDSKSARLSVHDVPLPADNKPERAAASRKRTGSSNLANHDQTCCGTESRPQETYVAEFPTISCQLQSPERSQLNEPKEKSRTVSKVSVRQISTVNMSTFQVLNLSCFKHERWALTALQLLSAKSFKLYDSLPPISPQELESLSNSDSLVKLLAAIQIGWLLITLLVRYKSNIISSQLEIATLAFSVCSLLTYGILWNRPRGVTIRYRVSAIKAPTLEEIMSLATFGPGYLWTWNRSQGKEDENLHLLPIPNDASHAVDVRNLLGAFENNFAGRTLIGWLRHNHPAIVISVIAGSVLGGTLFGGLHCLAWNFAFPTHTELVLWRICSIVTTVLPFLSIYFNLQWSYYNGWVDDSEDKAVSRFYGPVLLICFVLPYVLARIFLLIETFRSLFFLPPEAFIDTWPGAFLLWG